MMTVVHACVQVRSLFWGAGDLTLVSCGQDGAVYYWDVDDAKRVSQLTERGLTPVWHGVKAVSCVCGGGKGRFISSVGVPSTTGTSMTPSGSVTVN
jgi:WD40 repeat protein